MIISQVMRRYKDIKFSWKLARRTGYFVVFLFLMMLAYKQFIASNYFPITEVKIAGVNHIDHQEMQKILTPLVRRGFLNVNVEDIHERLLQFSWVREAYVRRVWPNQITIQVVEKVPLARWNEKNLLSDTGEIFSPGKNSMPNELMSFLGPQGEQMRMIQHYSKIVQLIEPLHFSVSRFQLTPAGILYITFTNGINLRIEEKDILTRLPHFVKVYPKIIGERVTNVDYVDLRYLNGLVVRWKSVT